MRCLFCVAVRGGLLDDADVYKLKRKVALGWRLSITKTGVPGYPNSANFG
jgi:hypothetical protein